jgi:exosortase sorting signal-containing protein
MSMNKTTRMKISNLGLLLAGTVSGKVLAGSGAGTITYAPTLPVPITPTAAPLAGAVVEAIQVPTLGGAALMILSFVLAVVAVRIIKAQKSSGTNLVAIVTAATSLAVGAGGLSLVSTPSEATEIEIVMDLEDGGVLLLESYGPTYIAENGTSKAMTISAITVNEAPSCGILGQQDNGGTQVPDCAVGLDIESGDFCQITIICGT